jgi:hypothetical protein
MPIVEVNGHGLYYERRGDGPRLLFVNGSGATYNLTNDSGIGVGTAADSLFTNAGTLAKTGGTGVSHVGADIIDTGAVSIASGTLEFDGATNSFAGLVSGAGRLAFAGGTQALDTGATLTVANWSLSAGAVTTLNDNLDYAGNLSQGAGTTLALAQAAHEPLR